MRRTASTTDNDTPEQAAIPEGKALCHAYRQMRDQLFAQSNLIDEKDALISNQRARIAVLEEQLRDQKVARFAASSEANPLQGRLFNDPEAIADQQETKQTQQDEEADTGGDRKSRPKRKGLNPNLPRVRKELLLSDEQREGAIKSYFTKVKEELDIVPAQVQVIEIWQERAVYCDDTGKQNIVAAEREPRPLGKSVASVSLLAYLIIAKYCEHMPLYRLEAQLKRYGGSISRSTLATWLVRLGRELQCVVNLLQEVQLQADYLQGDETRQQVLKEHGTDPTVDKWIWVIRGGPPDKPVVFFHYNKSRGGEVARELLEGFEGRYYQCDGYAGQKMAVGDKDVRIVGCMDHARRKFVRAEKALPTKSKQTQPAKCTVARSKIDALYRIEREMDKSELTQAERYEYRQKHAIPKLAALKQWLVANEAKVARDTLTHKAIRYSLNQWDNLIAYCDDGQLKISNVLVENAIRPFAVGRKNWLFSDTPRGAQAGAVYFTLIETAKANGLDPYQYLVFLIERIAAVETPEQIEALLPWHAKDHLQQ